MSEAEERTREAIKVRQVTDVHGNFSAQGQGEPGTFSLQFVLDDGAEERVLLLTSEDTRTLLMMMERC